MRRATVECAELGKFDAFVNLVAAKARPLLRPVHQLVAETLNSDIAAMSWGDDARNMRLNEPYDFAEVFLVDAGVIIAGTVNQQRTRYLRNPDGSRSERRPDAALFELSAFVSAEIDADAILDEVAAAAKATFGIELEDYYFRNSTFDELRAEAVAEDLPATPEMLIAARALADRPCRTLALSVKTSRGLLLKDIIKTSGSEIGSRQVDQLIDAGLASREVVVVCGVSQTQVARVPDKKSLAKLAKDGLRCACGKAIDEETPEDLVTISDTGVVLLDKSRWLSILVREELTELGVPSTDILLECQLGSDEIDCIALVSGDIVMLELKDKEFSMGNAYSFSAKISVISPRHSIIVTTDKVAADVKTHFSRAAKRDPYSTRRSEPAATIHYVEGDNFMPGLRQAVGNIYGSDARRMLDQALISSLPTSASVVEAVAKSHIDDAGVAADLAEPSLEDADLP